MNYISVNLLQKQTEGHSTKWSLLSQGSGPFAPSLPSAQMPYVGLLGPPEQTTTCQGCSGRFSHTHLFLTVLEAELPGSIPLSWFRPRAGGQPGTALLPGSELPQPYRRGRSLWESAARGRAPTKVRLLQGESASPQLPRRDGHLGSERASWASVPPRAEVLVPAGCARTGLSGQCGHLLAGVCSLQSKTNMKPTDGHFFL